MMRFGVWGSGRVISLSSDMAGIAIDSYRDKLTAFEFNLSAAGQKMDLKHVGDYLWDFNWNAVWDGATSKNDTSWVAEMRLDALDITFDEDNNSYSFDYKGTSWSFGNPDFSFSQFRSNLVFRWEYNLGSTLYLVWAHDRSDWEGAYNQVSNLVEHLFGAGGGTMFLCFN